MRNIMFINNALVLLAKNNLKPLGKCKHNLGQEWKQLGDAHGLLDGRAQFQSVLATPETTLDELMHEQLGLDATPLHGLLLQL